MDTLCQRLEVLTGQLSQSISVLSQQSPAPAGQIQPSDCVLGAGLLKSLPELAKFLCQATTSAHEEPGESADPNLYTGSAELDDNTGELDEESATSSSGSEGDDNYDSGTVVDTLRSAKSTAEDLGQAGALVPDSYGRLRYVTLGGLGFHVTEVDHSNP